MTLEEFQKLTGQGTVLLDGATGSYLRREGMPVGICTELWALEHPDVIRKLQRGYAEAGSQIVYAPTFSANRLSLSFHGLEGRIGELNTKLVALTRESVGPGVYVAGDVTTTGRILEPAGDISYTELLDVYKEQIRLLWEAGADLIVAETLLSVEEALVVLDAAQAVCSLPVLCSLTVQADGSLLYGGTVTEMVESLQEMGAAAVGLNCSVGPDQLEAVVASMKAVAKVPLLVKPNAGMPSIDELGNAHYSMGTEAFAAAMKRLVAAGAQLVGGCCGTDPDYIRLLAKKLGQVSQET